MARLHRPYVPLAIRVSVAARQLRERGDQFSLSVLYGLMLDDNSFGVPKTLLGDPTLSLSRKLNTLLYALFAGTDVELHHRPALVNRTKRTVLGKTIYTPRANDPEHLVYLRADDHDIETRIRGVGAQRSDLSQARYLKKVSRNRETRPKASGFPKGSSEVKRCTEKRKWPKRSFPKRRKA